MSEQQLTVIQQALGAFNPSVLREQIQMIQQAMSDCMEDGVHYGIIPGTERKDKDGREMAKPTLFKPGAEKLGFMFRLAPSFPTEVIDLGNGHREYRVTCRLTSIATGAFAGEGRGTCSTMESKYRYRSSSRKCPQCGKESIIKGKEEYGGGWICFGKKGGCNAKFRDGDQSIENQSSGKVDNPDIADVWNTCEKMAVKRAHVAAILTATAASDCFTQDLEDFHEAPQPKPVAATVEPAKKPTAPVVDETIVAKWKEWLLDVGDNLDDFNNGVAADLPKLKEPTKRACWLACLAHAREQGWEFDLSAKRFVVKESSNAES